MSRFSFAPRWLHWGLLIVLFPTFVSLGIWQLQRAEWKKRLLADYQARQIQIPHNFYGDQPLTADQRYQKVSLQGRYDEAHTLLLDNQFSNHQLGYHVLTPFVLESSHRAILINRGWIAANNRQQIPVIQTPKQLLTLQGILYWPDKKLLLLGSSIQDSKDWPKRIERLDFEQIAHLLGYNLLPAEVLLAPDQPSGFKREWSPVQMPMQPAMHRAYAFQWFAMAAALLIAVMVVSFKRATVPPLSRARF